MLGHVTMAINTGCNNSCIWCYDKMNQKQDINMSDQTFDRALSLIKQAGCKHITFLGGEPTLHSHLPTFVRKAAANSIDSVIISNGSGYSEAFLDAIEDIKHTVVLNIAIQGATSFTHDKVTNNQGSFEKLLNGIDLAKSRGFEMGAIMTLCTANVHELTSVFQLLEDAGIDGLLINYAQPPINVLYFENDYLTIAKFSEQIAASILSGVRSLNITVGPPLPLCRLSPLLREMAKTKKIYLNSGCPLVKGHAITIAAEGSILLCSHLTEVKTGNINDLGNIEAFNSLLAEIDIQIWKNVQKYPMEDCNTCKENEQCFGGCPLLWIR